MGQETWDAVDDYFEGELIGPDPVLAEALVRSDKAGLPQIAVTASQGKLLHLMAKMTGARRILEVGTLGGYSAIWLARALPDGGRLISLEVESKHAEVARANLEAAGLADKAQVRVGRGVDSLAALAEEGAEPFDFVFIDADKPSNAQYVAAALLLSHPGTVIVVDNVVREGRVIETDGSNAAVEGVRKVVDLIAREPRLTGTAIQTVGAKGYDGFIVALVTG
ncbi:MAG TPA: O-methyltransferase [Thermoleophilia bacterium]|nr:O-methyltransferase [Thermoleophilia bacterium]